jgi:hypothetical protein
MNKEIVNVGIVVVRASDFGEMKAAADAGDADAQRFLLAFVAWSNHAISNAAAETPGCFSCGVDITAPALGVQENNFGGLATATHDGATRSVGAFCLDCTNKGWKQLANQFGELTADSFELEMVKLH